MLGFFFLLNACLSTVRWMAVHWVYCLACLDSCTPQSERKLIAFETKRFFLRQCSLQIVVLIAELVVPHASCMVHAFRSSTHTHERHLRRKDICCWCAIGRHQCCRCCVLYTIVHSIQMSIASSHFRRAIATVRNRKRIRISFCCFCLYRSVWRRSIFTHKK